MTEQEFKDFYDLACMEAGQISANNSRVAINMILQMIAHLKSQTNSLNARFNVKDNPEHG